MRAPLGFGLGLTVAVLAGCPVDDGDNANHNSNVNQNDNANQNDNTNTGDFVTKAEAMELARAAVARQIYGGAAAGDQTIAEDTRFTGQIELEFENFTVAAGTTLRVQSGTLIRCTGEFRNEGTIIVEPGAEGGQRVGFDTTLVAGMTQAPPLGIATLVAGSGEAGDDSSGRSGGAAAIGLSEFEARTLRRPGIVAGGGGAAALDRGGSGGGSLVVVAAGEILNLGLISAEGGDGGAGGGGGGGGVVILASATAVMNDAAAMIEAGGGAGGGATDAVGPGGGGGGGIVHLIAPEIVNDGLVEVPAGFAGPGGDPDAITSELRAGGGGGGACGGAGGTGGGISAGSPATPAEAADGGEGFSLETRAEPSGFF